MFIGFVPDEFEILEDLPIMLEYDRIVNSS